MVRLTWITITVVGLAILAELAIGSLGIAPMIGRLLEWAGACKSAAILGRAKCVLILW